MTILHCDLETYSSVDLAKSGVHRYTEAPDFEILLFGFAFDDDPVQVVDLAQGEQLPKEVLEAMTNPEIIKTAYNAQFERTCLAKHFQVKMPAAHWRCSQAHALTLGLPSNLESVAECLRLDHQKMKQGKNLIRFFCQPVKRKNKDQLSITTQHRNMPEDYPEKWQDFKDYCAMDVEVERELCRKLEPYPMLEKEQKLWFLDQKINDFGVKMDKKLISNAIECADQHQEKLFQEARELTGMENPNSADQVKQWLLDNHGLEINSLSKDVVEELLKTSTDPTLRRMLELRQEMARTSVKKYEAMERTLCSDGRIRGLLQYYGANRGGRWAGRLVQVHNLPRNYLNDLTLARELLKAGEYESIETLFNNVPDVLAQLIRTAFVPSDGCRFIVCDFSAIEARVIAWLAKEQWRLDVFNSHGKIYEASAAAMFKVPVESIGKGSDLRQRGKVAELACGYQGGKGALVTMGALHMGLKEEELADIITAWRKSNPNIVQLWYDVERAAIKAVKEKTTVAMQYGLKFTHDNGMLFIQLPSGRSLAYVRPRIDVDERFNKDQLTYEGINNAKQWARIGTYGGKLVENIIQAIARDCLAESLLELDNAGYRIAFHVHDEAVLDMPHSQGSLKEVEEIMSQPVPWAPGLPMGAAGFETNFYMKD